MIEFDPPGGYKPLVELLLDHDADPVAANHVKHKQLSLVAVLTRVWILLQDGETPTMMAKTCASDEDVKGQGQYQEIAELIEQVITTKDLKPDLSLHSIFGGPGGCCGARYCQ